MSLWLVNPKTAATLQLDGPGANYTSRSFGLWDYPAQEPLLSAGYQAGAVARGRRRIARQFSLRIHIDAGKEQWPVRNEPHNQARDELIRFFEPEDVVIVRGVYPLPGITGYWEIEAIVQQMAWEEHTAIYNITLLAPEPTLKHTLEFSATQLLPNGGSPERTFTITVGGNVRTAPVMVITPTANKTTANRWARNYTIQNRSPKNVYSYAVVLPFDFDWHIINGRIKSLPLGGDIRVKANGQFVNRYITNGTADKLWIEVDMPAGATIDVEVSYGNTGGSDWVNTRVGPYIELLTSTNDIWRHIGGFKDLPGVPTSYSQQWNLHAAQSQGMAAIDRYLPSPFPQFNNGVNAAGGEILSNVQVQGYAGLAYHHPIGITQVVHSGYYLYDQTQVKLVLRGYDPATGAVLDYWELALTDTVEPPSAYGPVTTVFPSTMEAVVFALRSLSVHQGVAGYRAGATDVNLYLPTGLTPLVTGAGSGTTNETEIYMLEMQIENETTGEEVRAVGTIEKSGGVWQSVQLDFRENMQFFVMGVEDFYYAMEQVPPRRPRWLTLKPGQNTIRIRDEGVVGLEVYMEWQARRL